MQHLALQIGQRHGVVIDDADRADARRRQILDERRAKPACADHLNARGRLHQISAEAPLHDLAFTEKAYVAASLFCAVGAIAAINLSWGSFALFLSVAASLNIADQIMTPRMREAAVAGEAIPYIGTRQRFELLAAISLMFIFWRTAVPPLATLAQTYGIG
jgi:hypothetical protein